MPMPQQGRKISIEIEAELVAEICRVVRAGSGCPVNGIAALVSSFWVLKAIYLKDVPEKEFIDLICGLVRNSPKVINIETPNRPGGASVN
jgi:hypothetical protein